MSFCPSGRDDPDALITFRVSHMEKLAVTHPDQVNTFLAVLLASVEAFDSERVAEDLDRLLKRDAVRPPP
jgi:hypothetical protein